MPIDEKKKEIIQQCITRLVKKNQNTYQMMGNAIKGIFSGNLEKKMVSKVFDFDPKSDLPIDKLVFESLLNALHQEDFDELFRRYANHKGLKY